MRKEAVQSSAIASHGDRSLFALHALCVERSKASPAVKTVGPLGTIARAKVCSQWAPSPQATPGGLVLVSCGRPEPGVCSNQRGGASGPPTGAIPGPWPPGCTRAWGLIADPNQPSVLYVAGQLEEPPYLPRGRKWRRASGHAANCVPLQVGGCGSHLDGRRQHRGGGHLLPTRSLTAMIRLRLLSGSRMMTPMRRARKAHAFRTKA